MANRILIVEDDPSISDFIVSNLLYTGYEYAVFVNGTDAAQSLPQDHAFDLALLDIMLPGMDGFALMEIIRKYYIPVICVTAKSDVQSKIKGLRDGAEDYIVKPFEVLELLVRIEKVLDRAGKLKQILQFKDIIVSLENRTVTLSGEKIDLKPMEFELLVMLVRYKNRTLPRERLLNEIWGIDYVGGTRTVDVHIANLRKKLNLHDELISVSKIGYRLEDV